jgi:hypothetical protein
MKFKSATNQCQLKQLVPEKLLVGSHTTKYLRFSTACQVFASKLNA